MSGQIDFTTLPVHTNGDAPVIVRPLYRHGGNEVSLWVDKSQPQALVNFCYHRSATALSLAFPQRLFASMMRFV
jgi:hypothetical protein